VGRCCIYAFCSSLAFLFLPGRVVFGYLLELREEFRGLHLVLLARALLLCGVLLVLLVPLGDLAHLEPVMHGDALISAFLFLRHLLVLQVSLYLSLASGALFVPLFLGEL
jgi:hypothetical protein